MATMGMVDKTPTYLPGNRDERRQLADIKNLLTQADKDEVDAQFSDMATSGQLPVPTLSVPGKGSPLPLTPELADILLEVATQLLKGRGVTIVPRDMQMTTQEAAEMLGVSRPTLIKILERGEIPFEKIGRHRRILLKDLEEYRQRRYRQVLEQLDALTADEDPYATVDNPLIK